MFKEQSLIESRSPSLGIKRRLQKGITRKISKVPNNHHRHNSFTILKNPPKIKKTSGEIFKASFNIKSPEPFIKEKTISSNPKKLPTTDPLIHSEPQISFSTKLNRDIKGFLEQTPPSENKFNMLKKWFEEYLKDYQNPPDFLFRIKTGYEEWISHLVQNTKQVTEKSLEAKNSLEKEQKISHELKRLYKRLALEQIKISSELKNKEEEVQELRAQIERILSDSDSEMVSEIRTENSLLKSKSFGYQIINKNLEKKIEIYTSVLKELEKEGHSIEELIILWTEKLSIKENSFFLIQDEVSESKKSNNSYWSEYENELLLKEIQIRELPPLLLNSVELSPISREKRSIIPSLNLNNA